MKHLISLVLVLTGLVAGCGGAGRVEESRAVRAPSGAFVPPFKALEVTATQSRLLDLVPQMFVYAEGEYPGLFQEGTQTLEARYLGTDYIYREYKNGSYLGVTRDGFIFGLGPFTEYKLEKLGSLADLGPTIDLTTCARIPTVCEAKNKVLGQFLLDGDALSYDPNFVLTPSFPTAFAYGPVCAFGDCDSILQLTVFDSSGPAHRQLIAHFRSFSQFPLKPGVFPTNVSVSLLIVRSGFPDKLYELKCGEGVSDYCPPATMRKLGVFLSAGEHGAVLGFDDVILTASDGKTTKLGGQVSFSF